MDVIGTAIVGTGFIGPVHVEALRRLGRRIAGVLGSSPEKSRKGCQALGISKAYESMEDLLADPEVQVVHVASPNRFHFDQCREALAAGKHVVCEKPLAMNAQQSAELFELAQRTSVVTAVCFNIRFYPLCLEMRRRIAEGLLGTIYHVTGSYLQDWLLYETDFNWRVLAEEGGELRTVADIGSHWLDLASWITGLKPEKVCVDLRTFLPFRQRRRGSVETFQSQTASRESTEMLPINTEDYGSILLRFRGGANGCCTVSQVTAGRKNCLRLEIAGTKGSMAWNSEKPEELWIGKRDQPNDCLVRDPALLSPETRSFTNYPGGHNEGFPDTFKQLFRAIYDAIEKPGSPGSWLYPTFADGHRGVAVCEAVLRSHREQAWIEILQ